MLHRAGPCDVPNDPDELTYQLEVERRNPAVAIAAIQEIEVHLQYGIAGLKLVAWITAAIVKAKEKLNHTGISEDDDRQPIVAD
jgi:hypothetical protein